MTPRVFFASLTLSLSLACTHQPTTVESPVPAKGKPTAPVKVVAELTAKSAHVTVTFESSAQDVTIGVGGVDGLTVTGPGTVLEHGAFEAGTTHAFDVEIHPGEGRSALVVSVSGTFNGASRARVASFHIGDGPPPESPGTVMTTDDGTKVRVLPAGDKSSSEKQ